MLPMATTGKALWLVLLVAGAGCQRKDRAALGREARKAGDDLEHGVRKVGSLLENLGHDIKNVGERLDRATADERQTIARDTRKTLGDIKSWFKEDVRPKAEQG